MISKVSYRLVDCLELIEEAVSWNDGALCNECRAIDVIGVLLEKAVSVLWKRHQRARASKKRTPLSLGDSTHFLCHISLIKCPPSSANTDFGS